MGPPDLDGDTSDSDTVLISLAQSETLCQAHHRTSAPITPFPTAPRSALWRTTVAPGAKAPVAADGSSSASRSCNGSSLRDSAPGAVNRSGDAPGAGRRGVTWCLGLDLQRDKYTSHGRTDYNRRGTDVYGSRQDASVLQQAALDRWKPRGKDHSGRLRGLRSCYWTLRPRALISPASQGPDFAAVVRLMLLPGGGRGFVSLLFDREKPRIHPDSGNRANVTCVE